MDHSALPIGIITAFIGTAFIPLTILFLRENCIKNIFIGSVLTLVGMAIIWLDFQENDTFNLNIGISDRLDSYLLAGFVISLFILKGFFELREGSKNLKNERRSALQISKSKFQIMIAIALTGFALLLLGILSTTFL